MIVDHKLASFLLKYRSTLHAVAGVAPSVLFFNCNLKTVLDLLKPDNERKYWTSNRHRRKHMTSMVMLENLKLEN